MAGRRVVLVRHAKSAWPFGVPDLERPLAGKGRRNAQSAGQWLADEGPALDLVLCSPAVRARQTGEIVRQWLPPLPWRDEPRLYEAEAGEVLEVLRGLPDLFAGVLVIGHEPSLSGLVAKLSGPASDPGALAQAAEKFPTSAVAVLRTPGSWRACRPGGAVLETLVVPRAAR
ncbi:MAG: histidine phosphatase family protein [Kineosporiaceae bacterium]